MFEEGPEGIPNYPENDDMLEPQLLHDEEPQPDKANDEPRVEEIIQANGKKALVLYATPALPETPILPRTSRTSSQSSQVGSESLQSQVTKHKAKSSLSRLLSAALSAAESKEAKSNHSRPPSLVLKPSSHSRPPSLKGLFDGANSVSSVSSVGSASGKPPLHGPSRPHTPGLHGGASLSSPPSRPQTPSLVGGFNGLNSPPSRPHTPAGSVILMSSPSSVSGTSSIYSSPSSASSSSSVVMSPLSVNHGNASSSAIQSPSSVNQHNHSSSSGSHSRSPSGVQSVGLNSGAVGSHSRSNSRKELSPLEVVPPPLPSPSIQPSEQPPQIVSVRPSPPLVARQLVAPILEEVLQELHEERALDPEEAAVAAQIAQVDHERHASISEKATNTSSPPASPVAPSKKPLEQPTPRTPGAPSRSIPGAPGGPPPSALQTPIKPVVNPALKALSIVVPPSGVKVANPNGAPDNAFAISLSPRGVAGDEGVVVRDDEVKHPPIVIRAISIAQADEEERRRKRGEWEEEGDEIPHHFAKVKASQKKSCCVIA